MGQWPVDRLLLADDPLFKIKTALPPAENLRQRSFAFQRSVSGVPDLPLMQVDFAVAPSRLKGKASAALPHARHLQHFGRRKLVQISNQRVTRVDPFGRCARMTIETIQKTPHLAAQLPGGRSAVRQRDVLLLSSAD